MNSEETTDKSANELSDQNSDQSPVAPESPVSPDFPTTPATLPIVEPKSTSRKGLVILLVLLGVLSLGGGSAFAYYVIQANKPKPVVATVTTPSPSATPKPLVADAVLYQTSVNGKVVAGSGCSNSTSTLYRQPISGEKPTKVLDIPDGQQVIGSIDYYKNNLVFATTSTCESKSGAQVWLSKDGGVSFEKVFEAPTKDTAITSVKFGKNENKILIGYLPDFGAKNVVQEIDATAKSATDLFTASASGVYIRGYDSKHDTMYYVDGCYGCDGVSDAKMSVYDTTKLTTSILYDEKNVNYDTHFNKDFSKGIKIRAASTSATATKGYNSVNYVIDEFDTKTGKSTPLTTTELNNVQPLTIKSGYTDDGMVYYVKENTLYVIDNDKKSSMLLTADNPITEVYAVNKDSIIYKNVYTDSGSGTSKTDVYTDRAVLYDIKSKKSTPIVTFKDHQSIILGIAWK